MDSHPFTHIHNLVTLSGTGSKQLLDKHNTFTSKMPPKKRSKTDQDATEMLSWTNDEEGLEQFPKGLRTIGVGKR